jgi:hypothetical protein
MQIRSVSRLASLGLVALVATASAPVAQEHRSTAIEVTVFKSPTCGCCKEWVEHLRKHAFTVTSKDTADVSGVKRTAGVPERLHSCHTAFVNGYVVEGHVPAADIQRMLKDKPKIDGIAVPGMPAGSPGMEVGSRRDAYDVIAFKRDGSTSVYARH